MLFRKKHPKACEYCAHGTTLEGGTVLCTKKGIRDRERACRRFKYDPCKRIPPMSKAPDFAQYNADDFSL